MAQHSAQPDAPGQVTRILSNWDQISDPASELLPLVYSQLRAIARNRMSSERAGHTPQATALVHEAYMKLVRIPQSGVKFEGRARFFAAAAGAMRRILIDHARRRKAAKRGDSKLPLDQLVEDPADLDLLPDPDRLLALNDALNVLASEDAGVAQVVIHNTLGYAFFAIGHSAKALQHNLRAYAMAEKAFGSDDLETLHALVKLIRY